MMNIFKEKNFSEEIVSKVEVKKESLSQRFDNWITRVGLMLFDGKKVCPNETTWR